MQENERANANNESQDNHEKEQIQGDNEHQVNN